ncbi:hypothetical protein GTY85_35575 [Streptomyces sp. SID8377]|nr:hypothetical protein [Streptomyces sp. SID8377]
MKWEVTALDPGRGFEIADRGPMAVNLLTRHSLTPDGDRTDVRIDGSFNGAAVALMAGKLKDTATVALKESPRKLAGLVEQPWTVRDDPGAGGRGWRDPRGARR